MVPFMPTKNTNKQFGYEERCENRQMEEMRMWKMGENEKMLIDQWKNRDARIILKCRETGKRMLINKSDGKAISKI